VFLVILCVFAGATYLVLCGIHGALLASTVIIPSSHNIIVSLCCCNVDHFILAVTILKYDCKPTLNTIVRKMYVWLVFVNHEPTFEFTHSKPPPS
jgi:hypothetical protein